MTSQPGNMPLVRRDIATLDRGAVASLERGFAVLRGRGRQPTGLIGQADIHRTSCPHANWWFLPWHRAYLHFFEQILRDAAGDPSLTLPYWNWSASPRLPAALWSGSLNEPKRVITPTGTVTPGAVAPEIIDGILAVEYFDQFGSDRASRLRDGTGSDELEGVPHNTVHRDVGGLMSDPDTAAQDPIFWLHHANVDRIWALWAAQAARMNPADQEWLDEPLDFYDVTGATARVTSAMMTTTEGLGYRYDDQPSAATMEAPARLALAEEVPEETIAEATLERPIVGPEGVTVAPSPAGRPEILAREAGAAGLMRLKLDGVRPPGTRDVRIRVFVNQPDATVETPPEDPHHVATFAFFEHAHHGDHVGHGETDRKLSFHANLSRPLQRLADEGLYQPGDPLEFTLVPVPGAEPLAPEDVQFHVEKVVVLETR